MFALLAHMGEASETGEMVEMMRQMRSMGMMGWGMMPFGGGWTSAWLWLGGTIWLVVWVLVILVLVALLRWLWKKGSK